MKDIIYAGFAQFSYLDWHKLNNVYKGTKLRDIFGNKLDAFNQIITDSYINMYGGQKIEGDVIIKSAGYKISRPQRKDPIIKLEKDYVRLENKKKIYNSGDARLFYLYSENFEKPDTTPMFPKFGDWEFIYGYNHNKIKNEMVKNGNNELAGLLDSGFQASVFKNGNDIMIAIRGSDSLKETKHILSDWLLTNIAIGLRRLPEAIICALWLYEKVIKEFAGCNIHVAGHSMGGSLAQYIGIYGYNKKKPTVVTWNGLGVSKPEETIIWMKVKEKYFNVIKSNFINIKTFENIKNYNVSRDMVGSLKYNAGKITSVDTGSLKNRALLDENEELINEIMEWAFSKNFIKFLNSGEIKDLALTLIPEETNPRFYFINKIIDVVKLKEKFGKFYEMFKKEGFDLGIYHSLNSFLPFFENESIIPKKFNTNFLCNSYKNICQNSTILSDLKFEYDKELMKNNLYYYILKAYYPQNYLNFIESKEKFSEDTLKKKKIGEFNNMALIAGVAGGEPMTLPNLLPPTAKTSQVINLQNGNWVIKSNNA